MNLIQVQLDSIRRALGFIGYTKPKRIDLLKSIVATPVTTQIEVIQERDLDRDRPQEERERDYPSQYDEPEYGAPDEYPFQDFNYGP